MILKALILLVLTHGCIIVIFKYLQKKKKNPENC